MGVLIRGAKNAFRNSIRTLAVTLILALSIGLALIMLLSYQSVQAKIASVKGSIGNTITMTPAGAQGFEGGGSPLTEDQVTAVRGLAHVSSVHESLSDRVTPTTDTSLASAIDPGTLGARNNRRNQGADTNSNTPPRTFTIPIQVNGISDASQVETSTYRLTAGTLFDPTADTNLAAVGTTLASKNNLSIGSSFTAYNGTAIKVVAIYDAGNVFANAGITMPIKAVQRLSAQAGQVGTATIQVDDITNVDSVVTAIKAKVGADKADVTSNQDQVTQALTPLENIKNISLYSVIGAVVAGAVITLLTMVMIVRERRREIGVLKAVGSSNIGVVMQFVTESMVLTFLGSILGIIVGILLSNPVLNALVSNNTPNPTTQAVGAVGRGGGFRGAGQFAARFGGQIGGGIQSTIRDLHTTVGLSIILYGLLAAVGIAILGSALPAWLIAKVKPAEVMRGE